jgi:hypothetical protein
VLAGNILDIIHAKKEISKSQLHIELHYTWGDDISENNVTILEHIDFEENNVEMLLAKVFLLE